MKEITRKPVITAENIIRVLSVIVTIIFFCPTFAMSFSEQKVGVSTMNLVGGIKYNGEALVKPQFILLLCLLLPIAIFVVLFIRQITEERVTQIVVACAAADLFFTVISRAIASNAAAKNDFAFKSKAWFVFDIIFLLMIITLSVLVLLRFVYLEDDLLARFAGPDVKDTLTQVASSVGKLAENVSGSVGKNKIPKEDIMGYCFKCGAPIAFEDEICTSCGWPVPEDLIAEAEEERRAAEEARRAAEEAARKEAEERARREAEEKARREAEERARREAEEKARREAEEKRRAEEEKRRAEAERRRAEEEAWREEEEERRRRAEARRRDEAGRRRVAPPRRGEEDGYLDDDYVDERTDKELAKLAYGPGSDSKRGSGSRAKSRVAFCTRCGEKLPGDAVFCPYCGKRL